MMQTKQDPAPPISRDALAGSVDRAADALLKLQQPDGHWVFELEADATIPAEYVLLRHYLGEPVDAELERKIAVYLRRIQGKHHGWPLFHDGDFDMSASVKAYFALKMIGEPPRRRPHAPRARGDPATGRRREKQRLHPRAALAIRRDVLAQRAGDAGGDHAAAALVSVPHVQDFLLGAHGDRAAPGAGRAEAAGPQSEGRQHRRTVSGAAAIGRRGEEGRPSEMVVVPVLPRRRHRAARHRAAVSEDHAQARHPGLGRLREGTAERRRRPRRHLPGHGQQRDDV